MKKALKMLAMLLCVAAVATLSSCSKDNDVKELIGTTWKCTYSAGFGEGEIEENAYVDTIWKFSSEKVPYTVLDEYYIYRNGTKAGSYYFDDYDGDLYLEYISVYDEDTGDYVDYDYDFFFQGIYDVEKNKKELVLSQKETNYDGSRSKKVYLKFVQQ